MKKLLLLMIAAIFSISAFSQAYTEVLYLKNGSILKGLIIENVPEKSVKLQTKDGSIFVYQYNEIEKITKEMPTKKSFVSESAGYKGFVDLGYSIGVGDGQYAGRIDFTTSHGYQFNPYLFLGAGAGVNYYCERGASEWSFPVFANPRATLLDGPVSPFIDAKIGYSFGENIKGFYFSPGIGVHFNSPNTGMKFNFTAGYTMQNVSYTYYDYYDYYSGRVNLSAITLKFGIEF